MMLEGDNKIIEITSKVDRSVHDLFANNSINDGTTNNQSCEETYTHNLIVLRGNTIYF